VLDAAAAGTGVLEMEPAAALVDDPALTAVVGAAGLSVVAVGLGCVAPGAGEALGVAGPVVGWEGAEGGTRDALVGATVSFGSEARAGPAASRANVASVRSRRSMDRPWARARTHRECPDIAGPDRWITDRCV
jgi:hypothetical protein